MDFIKSTDIDFNKLELDSSLRFQKNAFYIDYDNNLLYKFFSNLTEDKRNEVMYKLDKLQSLKKDYIAKVVNVIYDDSVVGYTQEYIKGNTLTDKISDEGVLSEIKCILELSKNLEDLHSCNIIVSDLHFSNVMVNEKDRPIFIDQDSYLIEGYDSFNTSTSLKNYYSLKGREVDKNFNSDRIGLFLAVFEKMLGRDIYCISLDSYLGYYNKMSILRDLQPIFFELNKRTGKVPEVPYLHQVLKNYDNK